MLLPLLLKTARAGKVWKKAFLETNKLVIMQILLDKNKIECFIQKQNGDILIGNWGGGISLFDSTLKFKKNIRFPQPPEYNLICSFIQNDDGTIWAGCQHGYIQIYNPPTGNVQTSHTPELNKKTIGCITKDTAGNIWLGLHDGKIAEWNKKENKFYAYNNNVTTQEEIYDTVSNIFFDTKEQCRVGTNMRLKKFDTERRIFTKVFLKNKTAVKLNWYSTTETNNKGFEIERRFENESQFSNIGFVESKASGGNSQTLLNYFYYDLNSFSGVSYYRIKQIDIDNHFMYTAIKAVKGLGSSTVDVTIVPNPNHGQFKIRITGVRESHPAFITDMNGRVVKQLIVQPLQEVNVQGLPAATYILTIVDVFGKDDNYKEKIIIVH
jgi:hypothetical protein